MPTFQYFFQICILWTINNGNQFHQNHDDVNKWKHFPRYWPSVWGIQWSPVNSPHKGQWHGALMFSLICAWINGSVNNREASDLKCNRTHYDVILMISVISICYQTLYTHDKAKDWFEHACDYLILKKMMFELLTLNRYPIDIINI